MKYETHNEGIENEGGSLFTCLEIEYATLKKAFGKPALDFDKVKSDAEWYIKFQEGSYIGIYNYKDGKNYLGASGTPKSKITNWHISSSTGQHGVNLLKNILKLN